MILPERAFGSSATTVIRRGFAHRADLLSAVVAELLDHVRTDVPGLRAEDHEGGDRLTGGRVGRTDNGGFGDRGAGGVISVRFGRADRVAQHREDGPSVP